MLNVKLMAVRALILSMMVLSVGMGPVATAQVVIDRDLAGAVKRKTILRELTLEVDPFGGEFTQWLQTVQFPDYTAGYSFRWKLRGSPYPEGEYIVRDQNGAVVRRGNLQMAGRQQGFFNLSLKDLPQRPRYAVTVQGFEDGQPSGDPSTEVTLVFAENEPVPFLFAPMVLDGIIEPRGVPGISAAVTCSPDTFFEWHAGVRRFDSTVKVQPDDLWHIGSNTKAMTAVMIAKLIEEGHFSWDTTVWDLVYDKDLLPGKGPGAFPLLFPNINHHFKNVTVEKLASHRSGIIMSQGINGPTRTQSAYGEDPVAFREDRIERLLKSSHDGILGEWRYGQGNYMILGHLIEKVRGKPYEQVMREELFAPLGMTTATFGMPTDAVLGAPPALPFNEPPSGDPWRDQFNTARNVDTLQAVNGHRFDPDKPDGQRVIKDNLALPPVWNPAGGAYMSSKDFLKFTRLMMDGRYGSFSLNPSSLAMLRSPYMQPDRQRGPFNAPENKQEDPSYGWAWGQSLDGGWGQVLSHDGSYFRFYSTTNVYADRGFAVVATANIEGGRNEDGPDFPGDNAAAVARNWMIGQAKQFCAAIADRGTLTLNGDAAPVRLRRDPTRRTVRGVRALPNAATSSGKRPPLPPLGEDRRDFDVQERQP